MSDAQKYTNRLAGKHILIIGGTSGIGFTTAEASLEHGARVTISSSNQSRIDDALFRLATTYPSAKGRTSGHTCNLRGEDMEQSINELFKKTGKVDHVIHTAGDALSTMPLEEVTVQKIRDAGDVRFTSATIVAKYAKQYLNSGPESSVILTSGGVAERPHMGWSIVAGYAAGLYGLTRNLALELKPIRVNLVSPGFVDTELWDEEVRKTWAEATAKRVPTGRAAMPEDIAEAYLYLMKDRNCTGSILKTDSGSSLI